MKKVDVQNKDVCKIAKFNRDGYGDLIVSEVHLTKCIFRYGMSQQETNFSEQIQTDAHSYLDVDDEWVLQNIAPLQGSEHITDFYLIMNRYGVDEWYKIQSVTVGRTMLTDNVDNNIHVRLTKTAKMIDDIDEYLETSSTPEEQETQRTVQILRFIAHDKIENFNH